jgi:hypothetical protein
VGEAALELSFPHTKHPPRGCCANASDQF